MKLVLKRTSTNATSRCGKYVEGLKRDGIFNLTDDLGAAKKFDCVPQLLAFVARHDPHIGNYDIVRARREGWQEVCRHHERE